MIRYDKRLTATVSVVALVSLLIACIAIAAAISFYIDAHRTSILAGSSTTVTDLPEKHAQAVLLEDAPRSLSQRSEGWPGEAGGAWSASKDSTRSSPPTSKPTLISPISAAVVTTFRPTFEWTSVDGAAQYMIQVNNAAGKVYRNWYTAEQAGCAGGGNCTIRPSNSLSDGNYTWWAGSWNEDGYGPWSDPGNFTVDVAPPPQVTKLGQPSGNITTLNPAYNWTAVENASYYKLYLETTTGSLIFERWFLASDINCPNAGDACAANPDLILSSGTSYRWKVVGWNNAGTGNWSAWQNFTTPFPPSGKPTLITPLNDVDVTSRNPMFQWTSVSGASHYMIQVNDASGTVYRNWYTAAEANCAGGGTCFYTPSNTLASGSYTWWAGSWNTFGYGPWSDPGKFKVPYPPAAPTLDTPSNSATGVTPTYFWTAGDNTATHFLLVVRGPYETGYSIEYTAAACGCDMDKSCLIMPLDSLIEGEHTWWVRPMRENFGYGDWSSPEKFQVQPPRPSQVTNLTDPVGEIKTLTPTFEWAAVSGASRYWLRVYIQPGDVLVIDQTFDAFDLDCLYEGQNCEATLSSSLTAGTAYQWKVSAGNLSNGQGPWSPWKNFSTLTAPSAKPSLINPTGGVEVNTRMPTFQWTAVSGASHYMIQVNDSAGKLYRNWYTAAEASCASASVCYITPSTSLASGNYTWWAASWNEVGYGPWSNPGTFKVPYPPAAPVLNTPAGSIETATPTYEWTAADTSATHYRLLVKDGEDNIVLDATYTAVQVGCNADTSCAYKPAISLDFGPHKWWVRPSRTGIGDGSWSAAKEFTYNLPKPELISPTGGGSVTTNTPTFYWNAVSGATHYFLWIGDNTGNVYKKWWQAGAAACGGGATVCLAKIDIPLRSRQGNWFVQAWSSEAGYSAWSAKGEFFVNPTEDFNSQFTEDADGWTAQSGTTWTVSDGDYHTLGKADNYVYSAHTDGGYGNFEFSVKIKLDCVNCSAGYLIRGQAEPSDTTGWYSGIEFNIHDDGKYSIYIRVAGGEWTALQSKVYSPAIYLGPVDNTLRVRADGPELGFYINEVLVKQISNSNLANGTVGIKFVRKSGYTGNGLFVDYATLDAIGADVLRGVEADTVNEEQQQLNQAAPPSVRDEELTD